MNIYTFQLKDGNTVTRFEDELITSRESESDPSPKTFFPKQVKEGQFLWGKNGKLSKVVKVEVEKDQESDV